MGNPPMRPDGTVTNATSPVQGTSTVATTSALDPRGVSAAADRRLPPIVLARDQAKAAGAR
jgi:hypothetical protein